MLALLSVPLLLLAPAMGLMSSVNLGCSKIHQCDVATTSCGKPQSHCSPAPAAAMQAMLGVLHQQALSFTLAQTCVLAGCVHSTAQTTVQLESSKRVQAIWLLS